jgi:hypothetical protein
LFYCRFDPKLVTGGAIDPIHIPSPDLSSNCRSLSVSPRDVLYPLSRWGNWAIFKFCYSDVPNTVQGDAKDAPVHDVRIEHDPEEYNYGHCETRVYRNGKRIGGHLKPGPKNKLRLIFSRIMTLESPGLTRAIDIQPTA